MVIPLHAPPESFLAQVLRSQVDSPNEADWLALAVGRDDIQRIFR